MGIGKPFYERMDELGWAMDDISEQDGVRQLLRRSGVQTLRPLGFAFFSLGVHSRGAVLQWGGEGDIFRQQVSPERIQHKGRGQLCVVLMRRRPEPASKL